MTTTISPSLGMGALFTQQGPGTTPGYSAIDLRRSDSLGLQEGVYGASDFMVVQRGSGANMSVDITMPTGGFACVQGDSVSGQGLYTVPVHSTTPNEAIAAADATNPRVDQVILEVLDNVHDASGSSLARTRVLAGTPTSGANLTNRTGAAALPASALLLADVLVGNGVSTIPNTVIRDRRKWARGAYVRILRNANAAAGSDYTSSSATQAAIDATNLAPRVECSGVPLRVRLSGQFQHSVASGQVAFQIRVDGAQSEGSEQDGHSGAAGGPVPLDYFHDFLPSAGSHIIAPWFADAVGGGTATVLARSTYALELVIEEIVRQNAANNATTSG